MSKKSGKASAATAANVTEKISLLDRILGNQELAAGTMQSRLKSPVFWTALGAQILTLLVFGGVVDFHGSAAINNAVCAVLEVLVAFGILNNPTNGEGL